MIPKRPAGATVPSGKKAVLAGAGLILAAFVLTVVILAVVVNMNRHAGAQLDAMQEQVAALETEKSVIEERARAAEDEVGRSLHLDKLVSESKSMFGDAEADRREGALWIDHDAGTALVTLGALNGVEAGSRLAVYQDDQRIDFVRVQTPLDVISYVQPVNRRLADYKDNYYRVVMEK